MRKPVVVCVACGRDISNEDQCHRQQEDDGEIDVVCVNCFDGGYDDEL